MKKALSVGIVFSLLLMFFLIDVRAQQQTGSAPPLAQPLVREGDFAVKLAETLNMGKAQSEAEAESTLTSVGIAPRNGWIANYPVTPDIIGELRNAVGEAADSGRLSVRREEAERALDTLSANMGLSVVPETRKEIAQNEPPPYNRPQSSSEPPPSSEPAPYYGEYSNPEVVNNYYYDAGPPVVTYYPPPWDYHYMYAWVPYPFWWTGFFFPGYYILNDFSRFIVVGGSVVVVSNHYHDHWSRRIHRIDPVTRRTWKDLGWDEGSSHWKRGNTAEAREGASSIHRRSLERRSGFPATEGRERKFGGRDFTNPRPGERSEGPRPGERYERRPPPRAGSNPPASRERRDWPGRSSSADRWTRRDGSEVGPRERGGTFNNPPASSGRRERFSSTPPPRSDRSFSPPQGEGGTNSFGGINRSFGGEPRSFPSPSTGGRGSFEGSRGGRGSQGGGSGHGGAPKGGICPGGRC